MKTVSQKDLPTDPLNHHHHHHHHHHHPHSHPHQHPLALGPNILDIFPTSLLQPSPAAPSRNHGFKMGFDGEGSTFTRLPDYLLSPAIQPPKSKLLEILDQRFNDPRKGPESVVSDSESEDDCESEESQLDDNEARDEEEGESSEGAEEDEIDEEHPQPQRQGHSPTKKRHSNKGDMFHEKDPLQAQVWTLFTTAKCSLPNGHGRRLENLTWRLKGMSLNKKEEKAKKDGEEEATRIEDGMEVEATHVGTISQQGQDVLEGAEATPSVSETTLPVDSLSSDASQQQLLQRQQQQWLDLQLQQGPPLDTLLDTSTPPTIPVPTHIQDQPHPLLFPDDFSWIDSAMDPETLRVLSDFEMPEGAMWTAEAQKQLQMYLQSSATPSDQISSPHPPSTAPKSNTHVYDDVFNSNEDEDEHEDDGNDTDSTVTDLDPHLDANRMQDFDNNDSDVEECTTKHPKSKSNSAPVVVVQPPMHCNNCKTQQTSLWRRGVDGQTLCNACALFYKLHGRCRPKNLKSNVIKTRNRASMAHPSKKKSARNQPSGSGPALGTFPASSTPSTKIGDIPYSETHDKNTVQSSTSEGVAPGQDHLVNTNEDDMEQTKLISEMKNLLEVASSIAAKSKISEALPPTTTTPSLQPAMLTPTTVSSSHWEFSSSPATPRTPSSGQLPMVPPTSQSHFQGDFSAIENNPNYYSLLMDPISGPPFYHQTMGYFRPPPTSQPQPQQQFMDLGHSTGAWSMSSETAYMTSGTIGYVPVLVPIPVPVSTPCNNINTSSNINTSGPGPYDPRHQQAMFLLDQQHEQEQGHQFYQQTPWGYHRM